MEDLIVITLQISFFIIPFVLGIFVGTYVEKKHLSSLDKREAALQHILVTDINNYEINVDESVQPQMIIGEVVISTDYLKTFLTKLKKILGGELRSFETLVERARREALMRVKEEAHMQGFDAICNLRLETSSLGDPLQGKNAIVAVGMLASATAYKLNPQN